jgi:hypothetical protein
VLLICRQLPVWLPGNRGLPLDRLRRLESNPALRAACLTLARTLPTTLAGNAIRPPTLASTLASTLARSVKLLPRLRLRHLQCSRMHGYSSSDRRLRSCTKRGGGFFDTKEGSVVGPAQFVTQCVTNRQRPGAFHAATGDYARRHPDRLAKALRVSIVQTVSIDQYLTPGRRSRPLPPPGYLFFLSS